MDLSPILLSVNVLGKEMDGGPSTWAAASMWEIWMKILASAFGLSLCCGDPSGSKSVGENVAFYFYLSFSDFQKIFI